MGLQTEHNLLYYTTLKHCSIAQLVELVTVNHPVPGSSPGGTANKNVMAVVSWWWNHLKNLRSVAQSGRALALGARCREFESRYSDSTCGCAR